MFFLIIPQNSLKIHRESLIHVLAFAGKVFACPESAYDQNLSSAGAVSGGSGKLPVYRWSGPIAQRKAVPYFRCVRDGFHGRFFCIFLSVRKQLQLSSNMP